MVLGKQIHNFINYKYKIIVIGNIFVSISVGRVIHVFKCAIKNNYTDSLVDTILKEGINNSFGQQALSTSIASCVLISTVIYILLENN